jgi:flagellar motor switch protein FliN/FliY
MLATAQIVDIDAIHATTAAVMASLVPGSTVDPLDAIAMELSAQAVAITVTTPEGSGLFIVDALCADPDAFDAATAIEALVAALGETLEMTQQPIGEASDLAGLETGSHFRVAIQSNDTEIGEIRFSIAGTTEESDETAPPDDAPAAAPQAQPGIPDISQLASRLPNLAAVNMDVTVELGRVRLPIKELLGLGSGSVVRLGTPIGDSFDILVNGKAAARGDLVVVGGKLAVRIRELLGIQA